MRNKYQNYIQPHMIVGKATSINPTNTIFGQKQNYSFINNDYKYFFRLIEQLEWVLWLGLKKTTP